MQKTIYKYFIVVDEKLNQNNNPSGSEYTIIPSSDISTNTQIDCSEIFPENCDIDPGNPDEYLKQRSTPFSCTNLNHPSHFTVYAWFTVCLQ